MAVQAGKEWIGTAQGACRLRFRTGSRKGNGGSDSASRMVCMGSGISDGGEHKYSHLEVLVAGRAGGSLTLRGHINFKGDRPLAALWLTLAQKAGLKNERFADIKGLLKELTQAGPRAWTQAFYLIRFNWRVMALNAALGVKYDE